MDAWIALVRPVTFWMLLSGGNELMSEKWILSQHSKETCSKSYLVACVIRVDIRIPAGFPQGSGGSTAAFLHHSDQF